MDERKDDMKITTSSSGGVTITEHDVKPTRSAAEVVANPLKFPVLQKPKAAY
jgi:hypothetical protein